jgi:hypothetical protein
MKLIGQVLFSPFYPQRSWGSETLNNFPDSTTYKRGLWITLQFILKPIYVFLSYHAPTLNFNINSAIDVFYNLEFINYLMPFLLCSEANVAQHQRTQ